MSSKQILLILSLGLSVMACTGSQVADGFILKGHVEGIPDGTHVQLVPVSHDNEMPLADTVVVDGQFVFTGKVDEPRAVSLLVKDAYGTRRLMLENTQMEINGSVSANVENGSTYYDMASLSVSGSPLSARYDSLMSVRTYLDSLYVANMRKYAAIDSMFQEAYAAKNQNKIRELQQSEMLKAREADDKLFIRTVDSLYYQAVMDNKDSFWGPLLMISFTNYLDKDMASWYDALSPEAQDSYYGKLVKAEVYPESMEGMNVPEFVVKDSNGQEIPLSTLRKGNKYVLIDFWASWCNPCRKEIPNLKNLYAQYHDKGFEIISISIDKKRADWEKALKEEALSWPNYLDETDVAGLYKVKFVPTMYLIDGDGKMVGENLRGEELANKLKELFQ